MNADYQAVRAMTAESGAPPASRRAFLAGTGAVAAGTAGAALLGGRFSRSTWRKRRPGRRPR